MNLQREPHRSELYQCFAGVMRQQSSAWPIRCLKDDHLVTRSCQFVRSNQSGHTYSKMAGGRRIHRSSISNIPAPMTATRLHCILVHGCKPSKAVLFICREYSFPRSYEVDSTPSLNGELSDTLSSTKVAYVRRSTASLIMSIYRMNCNTFLW